MNTTTNATTANTSGGSKAKNGGLDSRRWQQLKAERDDLAPSLFDGICQNSDNSDEADDQPREKGSGASRRLRGVSRNRRSAEC